MAKKTGRPAKEDNKKVQVQTWIDPQAHKDLKLLADYEQRPLSHMVRLILEKWLCDNNTVRKLRAEMEKNGKITPLDYSEGEP